MTESATDITSRYTPPYTADELRGVSHAGIPFIFTKRGELLFGKKAHLEIVMSPEVEKKYRRDHPEVYANAREYDEDFLAGRYDEMGVTFFDKPGTQILIPYAVKKLDELGMLAPKGHIQIIQSKALGFKGAAEMAGMVKALAPLRVKEPEPEPAEEKKGPSPEEVELMRRREEYKARKRGEDPSTPDQARVDQVIQWMRAAGMDAQGNELAPDGGRWTLSQWADRRAKAKDKYSLPLYPPDWGVEGRMKAT